MDLLEIDSILKSYDIKQILTDIYLKCSTGDIIGLLGRNGTGKSTLLKIIFGTLNSENKFIRINNKVVIKAYLRDDLIKFLPQKHFLPGNLTVRQIINYYFRPNERENVIDHIISKVLDSKICQLSGGEGRYLEIKLILYSKAKFVLLDEPFNGVAPVLVDTIIDLIKTQSINKGIILTDHDYRNVLDVANRYYLLFDGGLKMMNDKNELIEWGYIPEIK